MLMRLALYLDRSNWRSSLRRELRQEWARRSEAEAELRDALATARESDSRADRLMKERANLVAAMRVLSALGGRFSLLEVSGLLTDLPVDAQGVLDVDVLAARLPGAMDATSGERGLKLVTA